MTFEFRRLEIPDALLIEATLVPDSRGYFMEGYKHSEFRVNGISNTFVQDNYSQSLRGVLRGLHYQLHPHAQGKLVSVIQGEIFDVIVDIRVGSPTYKKWIGNMLSAEDHWRIFVPVGCAHGFQVLSGTAEVMYKVTAEYAPDTDRGIAWNDPELSIMWPIDDPILSPKDAKLPPLSEAEFNFDYRETAE